MAYEKKNWVGSADPLNGDPGATAINASSLNHLETQYDEAVEYVDTFIANYGPGSFQFDQISAMATWTIALPTGFGRFPTVTIYVGGEVVDTDIAYSDNAVTITFPSPTAGSAVIS